jgi:hypothetical protein
MGYRSDVLLVVEKEAWENSLSLKEISKYQQKAKDLTDFADIKREKNGILLFYWECIKWYDDDEKVIAVQKTLRVFENSDSYLFIRVGENTDDLEEDGSMWNNPFRAQIIRKIEFDDKDCDNH